VQLIPLLSMVLVGATLVTLAFAFFSYLAFRYRESKAPGRGQVEAEPRERFFRRYRATG